MYHSPRAINSAFEKELARRLKESRAVKRETRAWTQERLRARMRRSKVESLRIRDLFERGEVRLGDWKACVVD